MNVFIITGTSKGLGKAIAKKLVGKNNHLFCISRRINSDLTFYAKEKGCSLDYYAFDLSNVYEIEKLMSTIFSKVKLLEIESITLINNAGTVTPVKRIENCKNEEIINNLNVNLISPILLTASFVKHVELFKGNKKIINISSGAAKKPYYGWSNYCASKAGLDLFTQSVGVEQNSSTYPVKLISLVPFIMDTEMQAEIRQTNHENFEQVQRFIDFKKDGILLSVDFVAEKVISILFEEDYPQGAVIDVRDMP